MLLWLVLLACAVFLVYLKTSSGQKADSVTRKSFHILGSFVFMLGILFDIELMRLAAGLAFGLLIFVEVCCSIYSISGYISDGTDNMLNSHNL